MGCHARHGVGLYFLLTPLFTFFLLLPSPTFIFSPLLKYEGKVMTGMTPHDSQKANPCEPCNSGLNPGGSCNSDRKPKPSKT